MGGLFHTPISPISPYMPYIPLHLGPSRRPRSSCHPAPARPSLTVHHLSPLVPSSLSTNSVARAFVIRHPCSLGSPWRDALTCLTHDPLHVSTAKHHNKLTKSGKTTHQLTRRPFKLAFGFILLCWKCLCSSPPALHARVLRIDDLKRIQPPIGDESLSVPLQELVKGPRLPAQPARRRTINGWQDRDIAAVPLAQAFWEAADLVWPIQTRLPVVPCFPGEYEHKWRLPAFYIPWIRPPRAVVVQTRHSKSASSSCLRLCTTHEPLTQSGRAPWPSLPSGRVRLWVGSSSPLTTVPRTHQVPVSVAVHAADDID